MINFYEFVYGIDYIFNKSNINTEPHISADTKHLAVQILIDSDDRIDCLNKVSLDVACCTKCRLSMGRTNIVFGEGSTNPRLMFIGEGPGYEEDRQGKPFVGRAGQLLTKMIQAMGLVRESVYIANIVKCRPPDNRAPFKDEAETCKPYLIRQIDCLKPSIIVCLGSIATNYLLDLNISITKVRGNFFDYKGIKVLPTYHPAYLLRNPNKKGEAWQDLQIVMGELLKK